MPLKSQSDRSDEHGKPCGSTRSTESGERVSDKSDKSDWSDRSDKTRKAKCRTEPPEQEANPAARDFSGYPPFPVLRDPSDLSDLSDPSDQVRENADFPGSVSQGYSLKHTKKPALPSDAGFFADADANQNLKCAFIFSITAGAVKPNFSASTL